MVQRYAKNLGYKMFVATGEITVQDFCDELRKRVAGLAIGGSTLRNMTGPRGVEIARDFCTQEKTLTSIASPRRFAEGLNILTKQLADALPRRKRPDGNLWGPARKVLNIFLSDATYNFYLREQYNLDQIERYLEVPLDSYVANGVALDAARLHPPIKFERWKGVVHVTPQLNANYQSAATEIAKHLGYLCRGHLDARYWRRNDAE